MQAAAAHLAKAMELLGHDPATAAALHDLLAQHDTQTVATAVLAAPLWQGAGDNAQWSVEAAVAARRRGKPITLIVKPSKRGTDAELLTGNWRLSLEG